MFASSAIAHAVPNKPRKPAVNRVLRMESIFSRIVFVVRTVTGVRLGRKVDQTDPLVVSNRLDINADRSGKLANAHFW